VAVNLRPVKNPDLSKFLMCPAVHPSRSAASAAEISAG
jgi:hypothetical protein